VFARIVVVALTLSDFSLSAHAHAAMMSNRRTEMRLTMSAPLEIKPETAEMLAAQATAQGVSVDDYLRSLLPRTNGRAEEKPLYETATPEKLAQAYVEWSASHDANTPVVLDDSRQVIYRDDGR
jgi:hypothetical protein